MFVHYSIYDVVVRLPPLQTSAPRSERRAPTLAPALTAATAATAAASVAPRTMPRWLFGVCLVVGGLEVGFAQTTCADTCASASDGRCDDGGLGAKSASCSYGTDCTDCNSRESFECSGPRDAGELQEALLGPGSGYDKSTRPNIALKRALSNSTSGGFWPSERDEAWTQLRVLSIDNVDTKHQKVTLQVYLNVIWFDWRLAWNTTADGGCMPMTTFAQTGSDPAPPSSPDVEAHSLHKETGPAGDISYGGDLLTALWQPTLYAENMIEEKVMASAAWLSPAGRVWWRRKAQWVLACPMDFRWMPFDEQRLFARISSWQYPPEELKITFGQPDGDAPAVIDDDCRPQNSEWTVLDMASFETTEAGDELGFFIIKITRKYR